MRTSARPRLPDGDCVFISDARIVARADAPGIAADMARPGSLLDASLCVLPSRFGYFYYIRVSKPGMRTRTKDVIRRRLNNSIRFGYNKMCAARLRHEGGRFL